MKVAVCFKDGLVYGHFGKCEQFMIYTTDGEEIVSNELVPTNGTSHAALIPWLVQKDVQILLTGGIGDHAIDLLSQNGIKVFTGVKGIADKNVKDLLEGKLEYDDNAVHKCSGH